MIKFVVFTALLAVAFAAVPDKPTDEYLKTSVSESAKVIPNQMDLPDVTNKEFDYKILLLPQKGTVDLTDGILMRLNNYAIGGDIKRISETRFDIPIKFTRVDFEFMYNVRFQLMLPNEGQINGVLTNLVITLPVEVVGGEYVLYTTPTFEMPEVDIDFSRGGGLTDILYNILGSTFHKVVKSIAKDEFVLPVSKKIIEHMNKAAETQ